jgi:hypothetical protein
MEPSAEEPKLGELRLLSRALLLEAKKLKAQIEQEKVQAVLGAAAAAERKSASGVLRVRRYLQEADAKRRAASGAVVLEEARHRDEVLRLTAGLVALPPDAVQDLRRKAADLILGSVRLGGLGEGSSISL